jgi:subtilase family serine protease
MRGRFGRAVNGRVMTPLSVAALLGATLLLLTLPVGGPAATHAIGTAKSRPSDAALARLVQIHPNVFHVGGAHGAPPTTADCEAQFHVACYEPAQIQSAYDLAPLYARGIDGRGQTIVIVDSFGSPTVAHDLSVFDHTFGIPDPPTITVIQPAGKVPPYRPTGNRIGWAGETDLDVEYAHTIAPGANILVVETPVSENEGTSGFPQIVTAEEYVIDHHLGGVISQSFSATEQTFPTAQSLFDLRGAYTDAASAGVTVLAASGDSGAADVNAHNLYYPVPVTSWPDSDPLVTGVGGTQLHLNDVGKRTGPDTVWNDTFSKRTNQFIFGDPGPNPLAGGGGRSIMFARPDYQAGVAGVVHNRRGVPDVSMSGACNGAVDEYQGFNGQRGWFPVCGTSEATPLFAGIVALADQVAGHDLGVINPELYQLSAAGAPGIVDVTSGNNSVSFTQDGTLQSVNGFPARKGYDLASGVGTVDAAAFVPELAAAG